MAKLTLSDLLQLQARANHRWEAASRRQRAAAVRVLDHALDTLNREIAARTRQPQPCPL